jgi:hypothetical protein
LCTHRYAGFTAYVGMATALEFLPAGPAGLTARFARLGFVDREGTASEFCTLQPLNGGFGRLALGHLNESKAFGTASVTVGNDVDFVYHAVRLKELAEVLLSGGIR